jgi:ATP-dependent DNA helicase RecG
MIDVVKLVGVLRKEQSDLPAVEVKSAAGGLPTTIERSICAMANLPGGGTIILGLDEKNGFQPVRLDRINDLKAGLASKARQALTPPVMIDIQEVEFEGRPIVVAEVTELAVTTKPCVVTKEGAAYLRFWDGDYRLSDLEVQGFLAARQTPRFDIAPVEGTNRGDLNSKAVEAFITAARESRKRFADYDDDELLRRMAVLTSDGSVTTAGLLALGEYPQQYIPNFCIRAAVLPEPGASAQVRVEDTALFTGSLSEMIDDAVAWSRRHSRHRILNRADGRVVDQYDFPVIAVRELVANSLVHRDLAPWAWSRATDLRIDAQQFRITNPGGLYGVSVGKLGQQQISSARNSQLLRICQFTQTADGRTVEALATGIPLVFAETDANGLPRPTFFDQALSFTAILHRAHTAPTPPASVPAQADRVLVTPADSEVLHALASGPLSLAEIAGELNITTNAARARLGRLRSRGTVAIVGGQGQPGSTYKLRTQPD